MIHFCRSKLGNKLAFWHFWFHRQWKAMGCLNGFLFGKIIYSLVHRSLIVFVILGNYFNSSFQGHFFFFKKKMKKKAQASGYAE